MEIVQAVDWSDFKPVVKNEFWREVANMTDQKQLVCAALTERDGRGKETQHFQLKHPGPHVATNQGNISAKENYRPISHINVDTKNH